MSHETGFLILKSNGKTLGASWGMGDCEPKRMGNTIIQFILSLSAAQREEMKHKVRKLKWIPDKRPHLESNNPLVRRRFNLPQLPLSPTGCPFPASTWWALTTLACVEKYETLIPFRLPENLLQRIMDGQRHVDYRETWQKEKVDWTWTVDFDKGTMMGQKRDHLGWVMDFDELRIGCFDHGLQAFPVKDWTHFGSVGVQRCRQVWSEEVGYEDGSGVGVGSTVTAVASVAVARPPAGRSYSTPFFL